MCPLRPENRGTERPLQNRSLFVAADFVEDPHFWGGHLVVLYLFTRRDNACFYPIDLR